MNIDVQDIGSKGLFIEDYFELEDSLLIEDEAFFYDNIKFSILFTNEGNNRIKAKGKLNSEISMKCVKCLEKFDYKINSKFEIVLFHMDIIEADNTSLNPDDLEYIFYEGGKIDVKKILTEQINFFLPLNPVCSNKCKGICPNCGTNLNEKTCKCESSVDEYKLLFNKIKR